MLSTISSAKCTIFILFFLVSFLSNFINFVKIGDKVIEKAL